jgi:hypothetical protein
MSRTAGNNEQREPVADNEGSNEEGEGGKGDGGGRASATRVKKRVRAARVTATATATARWVGNKEGKGNGDGDEGKQQGQWQRRQRGRWQRRRGWRVTKRARVTAATAMETATKASNGDEGAATATTVVGERRCVTRVMFFDVRASALVCKKIWLNA